uniref:Non-specific lipid-transfer protein n=1 Tax=Anthurium amnicola TaxID=1678845 RepID=A0A1D1XU58_9ARAE
MLVLSVPTAVAAMAAGFGLLRLATILVLVCIVTGAPHGVVSAVTCVQVTAYMAPCAGYVRGGGAMPPSCCSGVRGLNSAARTTPDRRQACACLKSLMASVSGLKPGFVAGIPSKCGVRVPYRISPSMDCSRVR